MVLCRLREWRLFNECELINTFTQELASHAMTRMLHVMSSIVAVLACLSFNSGMPKMSMRRKKTHIKLPFTMEVRIIHIRPYVCKGSNCFRWILQTQNNWVKTGNTDFHWILQFDVNTGTPRLLPTGAETFLIDASNLSFSKEWEINGLTVSETPTVSLTYSSSSNISSTSS